MTLPSAHAQWRVARIRTTNAVQPKVTRNSRFRPLNAVVFGEWMQGMTSGEVRVWIALYALADGDCRVRVGGATLGRYAGLNRTNALRHAAGLARRGLVRLIERGRSGQGVARTSNVYELLVPPPYGAACAETEEAD